MQKIKDLTRVIGTGQNGLMQEHVRRKQCKKLCLVDDCKEDYYSLKKIIEKFIQYFQLKK